MAFFALLWKARTIEKYRLNYEKEKVNSIMMGNTHLEQTLSQRWRHYRYDTRKRISRTFREWYPEGTNVSNFFLYLKTDQTFPNFLLKSMMGFFGGIILTYLCFMFFVFQLSISLIHATIMSSIIGVLLTLGLAFSYRIRCLVFLLIPQFFSRVGRYTLTCYALVLILTGPATNTLKNSEILSESMACSQEQIKISVHEINDMMKKPYNSMKDSLKPMIHRLKAITASLKETIVRLDRVVLSIVSFIQTSFAWLQTVADICNSKLGTPYDRCVQLLQKGFLKCQEKFGDISMLCKANKVAQATCLPIKPFKAFCYVTDFMDEAILASVKKKLRNFTEHLRAMFHVEVHIHHSYSYSSNNSRSASQVAAGIVTEIRNRADPLLTWLSWSSCVTSLFLLLIIFRAKNYQHMYETRSRFDNRYVTRELQELDLKRQRQGRETVLPLNRRERAKYITTSSFSLVASEKVYLNRSAVFMAITTFKLLIHMVADYSLYWVLMTLRHHGKQQSDLRPGPPHSGVHVSGSGFVARLFRSIIGTLDIPLALPATSPISCLPDPYPPDLRRYMQIGVLIFLLWFFALFEPYGLRLRHLIMGHYRPERAKARATWLYNHILRTRAGFMKFARRKLHREYKYSSESSPTFRQWLEEHIPFQCLRTLLGLGPKELHCLLCGTTYSCSDPDSQLTKCETPGCPGVYCISCFADIGQLCTICLSPADYGDYSDVSLEKGSTDNSDSEDDCGCSETKPTEDANTPLLNNDESKPSDEKRSSQRWRLFTKSEKIQECDNIALLPNSNDDNLDIVANYSQSGFRKLKDIRRRRRDHKYIHDWFAQLTPENILENFSSEGYYDLYSNKVEIQLNNICIEPLVKSVRVNTDMNHGFLLIVLMHTFTKSKLNSPRVKKQKKCASVAVKSEEQRHFKRKGRLEYSPLESDSKMVMPIKNLQIHNMTISERNLKNVVRSKKGDRTKYKIKLYEEIKVVIRAITYLMIKNEQISNTNQNGDTAPNDPPPSGPPPSPPCPPPHIENNDFTKSLDNIDNEGRKSKKSSQSNKSKKLGKQKGFIKIKPKNSRHRIADFHTFFSKYWNNIKENMIPCTGIQTRTESPLTKEKRNHKRRKKRKGCIEINDTGTEECYGKKDNKQTRNLRISAFLADFEWTKRDYKKGKSRHGNENEDTLFLTDAVPAAATTNRIVGMVQLKNLPFQWREAPKCKFCKCEKKRCSCQKPERRKLFGPISKQFFAKKMLVKLRNKISRLVKATPSNLVQNLLSNINMARNKFNIPIRHDTSICISKRASFFHTCTTDSNQENAKFITTDTLFKNERFLDDTKQDASDAIAEEVSALKASPTNTLVDGQCELIVSRTSKAQKNCFTPEIITKKCKCDVYDDIQRRWAHVKNCLSDKGIKKPLDAVRDFCSTFLGPPCTVDTCPKKKAKKIKGKKKTKEKIKLPKKSKKLIRSKTNEISIQNANANDKQSSFHTQTKAERTTETQMTGSLEQNEKERKEAESDLSEPEDERETELLQIEKRRDSEKERQSELRESDRRKERTGRRDTERRRESEMRKGKRSSSLGRGRREIEKQRESVLREKAIELQKHKECLKEMEKLMELEAKRMKERENAQFTNEDERLTRLKKAASDQDSDTANISVHTGDTDTDFFFSDHLSDSEADLRSDASGCCESRLIRQLHKISRSSAGLPKKSFMFPQMDQKTSPIRNSYDSKGINVEPEVASGSIQVICPDHCTRSQQWEKTDNKAKGTETITKIDGIVPCFCDCCDYCPHRKLRRGSISPPRVIKDDTTMTDRPSSTPAVSDCTTYCPRCQHVKKVMSSLAILKKSKVDGITEQGPSFQRIFMRDEQEDCSTSCPRCRAIRTLDKTTSSPYLPKKNPDAGSVDWSYTESQYSPASMPDCTDSCPRCQWAKEQGSINVTKKPKINTATEASPSPPRTSTLDCTDSCPRCQWVKEQNSGANVARKSKVDKTTEPVTSLPRGPAQDGQDQALDCTKFCPRCIDYLKYKKESASPTATKKVKDAGIEIYPYTENKGIRVQGSSLQQISGHDYINHCPRCLRRKRMMCSPAMIKQSKPDNTAEQGTSLRRISTQDFQLSTLISVQDMQDTKFEYSNYCPACQDFVKFKKAAMTITDTKKLTDAAAETRPYTETQGTVAQGSSLPHICSQDERATMTSQKICSCATQHMSIHQMSVGTTKPSQVGLKQFPQPRGFLMKVRPTSKRKIAFSSSLVRNVVGKGLADDLAQNKCTHYTASRLSAKKAKVSDSGSSKRHVLSLESLNLLNRRSTMSLNELQDVLGTTDTGTSTDTSTSDISVRSCDTTVYSVATMNYKDIAPRKKVKVKVVTKANQSTLTDKARLCDTGTLTSDWWSPMLERKTNETIRLEKKKGYNAIERQKKEVRRRSCGVKTDGRVVTFRSRTQIIPTGFFPAPNDIMSPSRYLLESQKYYNELFSYNFHPPSQLEYACVSQAPKFLEKDKMRSPLGSRRNHSHKTKRLDECYSPIRQISPRKRYTESSKTSDTPRRISYAYRNTRSRFYSKNTSPRKK